MRGFRLFPDRNEELRAMSLLRVGKGFDLIEGGFIEVDVLSKRSHVTRLFANDFGRRVLDDAAPCSLGRSGVPTKSSGVWLMPHTLALRLRAVRKS